MNYISILQYFSLEVPINKKKILVDFHDKKNNKYINRSLEILLGIFTDFNLGNTDLYLK